MTVISGGSCRFVPEYPFAPRLFPSNRSQIPYAFVPGLDEVKRQPAPNFLSCEKSSALVLVRNWKGRENGSVALAVKQVAQLC